MNFTIALQAAERAIQAARAVPGVRWTIVLPKARITYWTDEDGEHVQTPNDYPREVSP